MKSLSRVQLFETPWSAAYQAPPSMGFSREEYWSGVPLPSPKGGNGPLYICICAYIYLYQEKGERTNTKKPIIFTCIGERNGNPLQCSCLENSRDGGAWWAAVYGVAQSRTRLKRLSSSSSSKIIGVVTFSSFYFHVVWHFFFCFDYIIHVIKK